MLTNNFSKALTLRNDIKLGEVIVKGQTATINSNNPEDINFSEWINNKELYKANRKEIYQLEIEFKEMAFAEQDKMIAEQAKTEE